MESFASWCVGRGLSSPKIRGLLAGLRRLGSWFDCKHKQGPEDLSEDDIADAQRFYCHRAPRLVRAVVALGEFLRAGGGLKPGVPLRQFRPRAWRMYADLPVLGGVLDEYLRWCVERGYAPSTIRLHLDGLRALGCWFRRRGKGAIAEITAADFEVARRFYRVRRPWVAAAIHRLGGLLKQQGRLKPAMLTPAEKEMAGFEAHLREECGLSEGTISSHGFYVRLFLAFVGAADGRATLAELKLPVVHRFLCRMARRCSRPTMANVVGMLRKFLRFEFLKGVLREPLHLRLDSVRLWRDERLPLALPWPQLQKMLRRADRSTPLGRRDFAILLLAASYGLRRSEVAALRLDDIDWRSGVLRVAAPKTGKCLRLPLTGEVAAALVDYLQHGRPASAERHLFVRVRPPAGALGGTGVALCLARAVRATGVDISKPNFHALRHAFAMRLLLNHTALEHISGVLGHRSMDSTSVYLRLDVEDLREVALPVPRAVKLTADQMRGCESAGGGAASQSKRRPSGSVTAASKGWRSFLAKPMQDFLRLHRALGRSFRGAEWILRSLDAFLARRHPAGRVFTAAMFEGWAAGHAAVGPRTRRWWMLLVRKFTLYLARTAPGTFVPDSRCFPKAHPCAAPCLLSERDVARLLAATHWPKALRTAEHPLRPKTMHLAVLLLYCCGLRVGELLGLRLGDIDIERRVLHIEQTKFHKSRLVPLCASVSEQLRKYLRARRAHHTPTEASAPLIWSGVPNGSGGAFSRGGFKYNWWLICRHAGVFNHRGRPPRIHDLRHSFAVAVLQRAYQQGRNAQATLPRLARYMGHAGFEFTHHYLHFTESLRLAASERFGRLLTPMLGAPLHLQPSEARAR